MLNETAAIKSEQINLRRRRAEALTSDVMSEIGAYIAEDCYGDVVSDLVKLFTAKGIDFVTDDERERAGLPPRNEQGYTADELRSIEALRMELLNRTLAPVITTTLLNGPVDIDSPV